MYHPKLLPAPCPPFLVSRQPFTCFLALERSSHSLEFYRTGITQCVPLVDRLLARSILILRLTHVAHTSSCFLCVAGPGCAQTLWRANPSASTLVINLSLPQAPSNRGARERRRGSRAAGCSQWDRPLGKSPWGLLNRSQARECK